MSDELRDGQKLPTGSSPGDSPFELEGQPGCPTESRVKSVTLLLFPPAFFHDLTLSSCNLQPEPRFLFRRRPHIHVRSMHAKWFAVATIVFLAHKMLERETGRRVDH